MTDGIVDEVVGHRRFGRLGVDEETARLLAAGSDGFVDFVWRLFDSFAAAQDKPWAGEKDPEYVRRIPLLHELFPTHQGGPHRP